MLRILVIVSLVGALLATALGAAAQLDVEGGAIQAGSDTSLQCDTDGVQVLGWGLETDTGQVNFVRIGDIDEACVGNDLFVNITSGGTKIAGGSIGPLTLAQVQNVNGVTVNFTAQDAEDITDIEVFIEGPESQ